MKLTGIEKSSRVSQEDHDRRIREISVSSIDYSAEGDADSNEICFLSIRTTEGDMTVQAPNEHDGYYGGFDITGRIEYGKK